MTMPIDLVLVRHGESEGNVAIALSKKGDHSHFTPEFKSRHNSTWALTDRGARQALSASLWIQANLELPFNRFYVSSFLRARHTAKLLNLPDAQWYIDNYLRERDRGLMDVLTNDERIQLFSESIADKRKNSFYWRPPSGESMADMCMRIDRFLDTLHRHAYNDRVVVVCHGEVMWAFRMRIEKLTPYEFVTLDNSDNPHDTIRNCHILHYSRVDPKTGKLLSHLDWMRSICPWDNSLSRNTWEYIERKSYTNDELLLIG